MSAGQAQAVMISGPSGIGKSNLAQTLRHLTAQRHPGAGFFIAGRFDQTRRNIPYDALIQAFQELIRQFMLESENRLAHWREQLAAALGSNAALIIEVIPQLRWLIGAQPPVPPLAASEARNRFTTVFLDFMRVFTRQTFILFLDDLQWADAAMIGLLRRLMDDPTTPRLLLLIGSYRALEPASPLASLLEGDASFSRIALGPLVTGDVTAWVADTVLFDSLVHLNQAIDLIAERAERLDYARLNLHAAQKAATSIAYDIAAQHCALAWKLLVLTLYRVIACREERTAGIASSRLARDRAGSRYLAGAGRRTAITQADRGIRAIEHAHLECAATPA